MKTLETERLILRKFKEDDFNAVHSYASSKDNTVYMLFGVNDEAATRAFIQRAITKASEIPIVDHQFAVTLKDSNILIGACDLHVRENEAEIGWILHRDYWKSGYGTELGNALLMFGFNELNLHRIIARCDSENISSSRLMEKIGMRREGLFFDVRPPHKESSRAYGDELSYAILKDEWEIKKEIAYYNSLPCVFNGFIDVPPLTDGVIYLVCMKKNLGNPEKKHVPGYEFAICKDGEKIGQIGLRIGYGGGFYNSNLYYGGQIGYDVDEPHRGNGYAVRACRLLVPVAKAHNMEKLLITNNESNNASKRVCEKLGARHVRLARLPEWTDLYKEGQRFSNIFEWNME
jgi:RimJ/RimL family protein N-acetyltransferase